MDGKLLALFIVMVVFGSMAFERWLKLRQPKQSAADAKERDADRARIKKLEERVATLERILTDKSERLKREIDALDDEAA